MNHHLTYAIQLYNDRGEQFANLLSWHSLHGVAVIDRDCVLLGYYADSNNLDEVAAEAQADTFFISYFGGDLARSPVGYADLEFIAYERMRNRGRYYLHRTETLLRKFNL